MEEQTAGLNVETVNTAPADTEALDFWVNAEGAEVTETGEALATGETEDETGGDNGETQEVPATDKTSGAEESNPPDGDAEDANPAPDKPNEPPQRILRYRDNHEDKEFNVSAATDAELIAMRQEANQYRRMKAAQAEYADAEKFRAAVQTNVKTFLDEYGLNAAKAMAVATAQADGHKVYPISVSEDGSVTLSKNYLALPEIEPTEAAESAPQAQQPTQTPKPTLDAELLKLRAAFPDLTEIPAGVDKLMKDAGLSLFEAVMTVQMRNTNAKAAETAKQNRILRQNAEAARRAPVTGVSGGGTPPKPTDEDPFVKGLFGGARLRTVR